MTEKKISALDSITQLSGDDLFVIVDNPSGTPTNKKVSVDNMFGTVPSNTVFTANVTVQGSVVFGNNEIRITTSQTPANSTITKTHGHIFWDSDYIYVTTANNVVKRVALNSF